VDFFEQQQQARRQSGLMLLMFLVAVAAIVAVLNLVGALVYAGFSFSELLFTGWTQIFAGTPRSVYLCTTALTLGVISFGTLKTLYDLSAGGVAVAEMVGARRVRRDSADLLERRLLNIVEEMGLAAGIAVPLVYVMDSEPGINAFAAGYSPNEAVVAVTAGALRTLTRDELQGVVAHEFSHILNGDMRLNIRLLGVIAGIVMIGALGRFLMDGGGRSDEGKRRGDGRAFLLGLTLWIVGSIGVLAGRMIKAAVARQREFLADASAVQFTRNADGICAALYKIGTSGALIRNRHAEDLSHMYFGNSVSSLFGMLSTHPPLDERIARMMGPGAKWLLRDRARRAVAAQATEAAELGVPQGLGVLVPEFVSPLAARADGADAAVRAPLTADQERRTTADTLVASVGTVSEAQVDFARALLRALPEALHTATRNETGARAALFALLLGDNAVRKAQLQAVSKQSGEGLAQQASQFADMLPQLGPRARMPLLELVIPTLKVLPGDERDAILGTLKTLAHADGKLSLGEFVLLTICERHFGKPASGAPPVKHKRIDALASEAAIVLSLLARAGGGGRPAFDKGMQSLGLSGGVLRSAAEFNTGLVASALYELKLLAPLKKPLFIKACVEVVMADGQLSVAEGELMRALCAALDSPLPPLIEGR
jgi:Zn-dependent protease with chaperone function/uncharacterized tellurite resistance protein B-like protein